MFPRPFDVVIVPSDSTHDFAPTSPPLITTGQTILFQWETRGEVLSVVAPGTGGTWLWSLAGPTYVGIVEGDPTQGAVWIRRPKPAKGTAFTAADGSRWVYPAQPHGLYRCWQAGTVHAEGLAHRSEIDGLVAD